MYSKVIVDGRDGMFLIRFYSLILSKRREKNKINKRRRNNLSIKRLYLLQQESTLSNA